MPATSATHAIFFVISVLVAVSIAGVMYVVVMDFSESLEDESDRLAEDMETDITIVNDERTIPYSNSTLSIYVMNTGRRTLNYYELVVFVDGSYRNVTNQTLFQNQTEWLAGTTVNLSVEAENLSYDKDHTLKVILRNGDEDSMIFRLKKTETSESSEILIINDSGAVPYKNNETLEIYVKNTGKTEIDINSTSILINGELSEIVNTTYRKNETSWTPDVTAVFNVTSENLSKDDTHKMKVVVEDGVRDSLNFKIKEE